MKPETRSTKAAVVLFASAALCAALLSSALPLEASEAAGRAAGLAGALRSRGVPPILVTGLISLLPIFELRGAIPVGVAIFKLDIFSVYAVAVLFNVLPVLPVLFFLNPARRFLERRGVLAGFFAYFERKAEKNRRLIERYEELGLALFVAIPLPMTGAWTGALLAVVMGLKVWKSFFFIALGVAGAGVIVALFTALGRAGIYLAGGLLLGSLAAYVLAVLREKNRAG
jgi:uncharacterized membrane protein